MSGESWQSQALGAALIDKQALADLLSNTRPEFFHDDARVAFDAISDLTSKGIEVDAATLFLELEKRGTNGSYAIECTESIPTASGQRYRCQQLAEAHSRDVLIETATRIAKEKPALTEALRAFDEALREASDDPRVKIRSADEVVCERVAHIERVQRGEVDPGLMCGIRAFDDFGGLHKKRMTVCGGRPGNGKSALALQLVSQACDAGGTALVFSAEMPDGDNVDRLFSMLSSDLSPKRLQSGELTEDQLAEVYRVASEVARKDFAICDSADLTIQTLRAAARRHCLARPTDLIVVDYLQLIGGTTKSRSREQEVAEVSKGLRAMAKELDCHVFALAQLNRSIEERSGEPRMSDIRESGQIEADADYIMVVTRDAMSKNDPKNRDAKITVLKNRHGPCYSYPCFFYEMKFNEHDRGY